METPIQLIVGLGNPGTEYRHTRHNAGEDFVRLLASRCQSSLVDTPKFFGFSTRANIANTDVRLLIPSTFMNLSGKAIAALAQFYKIPPESILVAHDELDLSPGVARLKLGGGHGGHNGLRDTISALANNKNFARLRIGIGHPGNSKLVSNYVLKRAPAAEQQLIESAIDAALDVIETAVSGEWNKAMRTLHSKI